MYKKVHYDLPFNNDSNSKYMPIILGFLTTLCCLSIALVSSINHMTKNWESEIDQKYTFEIQFPIDTSKNKIESLKEQLSSIIQSSEDISSYEIIPSTELIKYISPWLGDTTEFSELPLPILVNLNFRSEKSPMNTTLIDQLSEHNISGFFHDYAAWSSSIFSFTHQLVLGIGIVMVAVFVITSVLIIYITNSSLTTHLPIIKFMHCIGADDRYIVQQFQKYTNKLALIGGLLGLFFSAICLIIFHFTTKNIESIFFPQLYFSLPFLLYLLLTPMVMILISQYTTKVNINLHLKKLF